MELTQIPSSPGWVGATREREPHGSCKEGEEGTKFTNKREKREFQSVSPSEALWMSLDLLILSTCGTLPLPLVGSCNTYLKLFLVSQ